MNPPKSPTGIFDNSFLKQAKVGLASQLNLSISQIASGQAANSFLCSQEDSLFSPHRTDANIKARKSQNQITYATDQNASINCPSLLSDSNDLMSLLTSFEQSNLSSANSEIILQYSHLFTQLLHCPFHQKQVKRLSEHPKLIFACEINSFLEQTTTQCEKFSCQQILKQCLGVSNEDISQFSRLHFISLRISIAQHFQVYSPETKILLKMSSECPFSSYPFPRTNSLVHLQGQFSELSETKLVYSAKSRSYQLAQIYQFTPSSLNQMSMCLSFKVYTFDKYVASSIKPGEQFILIGFTEIHKQENQLETQVIEVCHCYKLLDSKKGSLSPFLDSILMKIRNNSETMFDQLVRNFLKRAIPANYGMKALVLLAIISNPETKVPFNILFLHDKVLPLTELVTTFQQYHDKQVAILEFIHTEHYLTLRINQRINFQRCFNQLAVIVILDKKIGSFQSIFSFLKQRLIVMCNTITHNHLYQDFQYQSSGYTILNSEDRSVQDNCSLLRGTLKNQFQVVCRVHDSFDPNFVSKQLRDFNNFQQHSKGKKRKNQAEDSFEYFKDQITSKIRNSSEISEFNDKFYGELVINLRSIGQPKVLKESENMIVSFFQDQIHESSQSSPYCADSIRFLIEQPYKISWISELCKARAKCDLSEIVQPSHVSVYPLFYNNVSINQVLRHSFCCYYFLKDVLCLLDELLIDIIPDKRSKDNNQLIDSQQTKQKGRSGTQKQTMNFLKMIREQNGSSALTRPQLRELFDRSGIEVTACFDDFIDSLYENDYFTKITPTQYQLNLQKI